MINLIFFFRLYVTFKDEDGQDAGGVLREWYQVNRKLNKYKYNKLIMTCISIERMVSEKFNNNY